MAAVATGVAEAAGYGSISLGGLTLVGSHVRGRQSVGRGIRRAGPTVGVREPTSGRAQVDGARSAARVLAMCWRQLGPVMWMRMACMARRSRIAQPSVTPLPARRSSSTAAAQRSATNTLRSPKRLT